ncbi:hypothetical protein [Sulfuricurvum sp.]|uniref:hypothetical protein n=1 Tax=Sulfuricurvum sp. TaxID=2025608 RepID=UPI002639C0C9|nr:hypothetical protein [Sulfuricurvum sp.]MDD3597470.1 hypothetical protein [Sulfuricurvum sp.]
MENLENVEMNAAQSRRAFLKKAAYVAPAVVALGALSAPVSAQASTFNGNVYAVDAKTGTVTQIGTATVNGQSGPQVIENGATVRLSSGEITHYDAAGVEANANGWFSWAKKYFSQIQL